MKPIEEKSHAERMINAGEKITLKKLGEVRVRELPLEDLIKLGSELLAVAQVIDFASLLDKGDQAKSGLQIIQVVLANPKVFDAAKLIAASVTFKEPEDFNGMGLSDWLKLVRTIQLIMDWEEIKELFTEIAPLETLRELNQESQTSSTNSRKSMVGQPVIS